MKAFKKNCSNNFDRLPTTNCIKGQDRSCPWFIKSKKHKFCFWVYLQENSDVDGFMEEKNRASLAKLLNLSTSKIYAEIGTARDNFCKVLKCINFWNDLENYTQEK